MLDGLSCSSLQLVCPFCPIYPHFVGLFYFFTARVTDGILIVVGESRKTKSDLFTAAYILQAAGLGLLMLSSLGFIGLVYVPPLLKDDALSDDLQ
jgi:hypothetical protein